LAQVWRKGFLAVLLALMCFTTTVTAQQAQVLHHLPIYVPRGAMIQNSSVYVQAHANEKLALLLIDTGTEVSTFKLISAFIFEPTRRRRANLLDPDMLALFTNESILPKRVSTAPPPTSSAYLLQGLKIFHYVTPRKHSDEVVSQHDRHLINSVPTHLFHCSPQFCVGIDAP
jgi:hypothetical protein